MSRPDGRTPDTDRTVSLLSPMVRSKWWVSDTRYSNTGARTSAGPPDRPRYSDARVCTTLCYRRVVSRVLLTPNGWTKCPDASRYYAEHTLCSPTRPPWSVTSRRMCEVRRLRAGLAEPHRWTDVSGHVLNAPSARL